MKLLEQKREKVILFIYLAGFLCLVMTLALFQPLENTMPEFVNPPDEHARFLVPWYICQTGEIPTGFEEEVMVPGYGFSYALYNAFPYIVQGMMMRLAHCFTDSKLLLLYVGRLVNVMSGLLMALVIYRLSGRLFRDRRFQWLFCFAVMYWPEVIFVHSYVNTDSICLLSTAVIVHALVRGYQEGFRKQDNVWLSLGIILCALSYYNAYGYILVSIFLFAAYFIRPDASGYNWQDMFKKGLFISILVLLGISWWFVRSGILYNGDILGLKTSNDMKAQYALAMGMPSTNVTYSGSGKSIGEMLFNGHFQTSMICSFIAAYGSMSIFASVMMYRLFKVLILAAAVGCVWQICSPVGDGLLQEEKVWKRNIFHAGMLMCILIPWILAVVYSYYIDYQPQGRYVLVCIVPFIYYVVRGLQRLSQIRIWIKHRANGKNAGLENLPLWLQNVCIFSALALFVGSSVYMVFIRTLPLYLEAGGNLF